MTGFSELRLNCIAHPAAARPMRHAVAAFIAAAGDVDADTADNILTAVGDSDEVELLARLERDRTLAVDVWDRGTFLRRDTLSDRGFGLRIISSIARSVSIDIDDGTHVRMLFTT